MPYMELTDPERLVRWMKHRDISYGELGRAADVSKQFVWQLATGKKRTCKEKTARRIEKFLLPPVEQRSPGEEPLFVLKRSGQIADVSDPVGVKA